MDRLLLVDGHSNLYRAHYAIRAPLTAPDGTPTGAVYGFLRMLHRLLAELEPSHVGVAFDVSRVTFRTRLDERYKAHRKPMPPELEVQIPLVHEALEAMGIPRLELPDYEADDVMGTLARRAAEVPLEVVIATSDKDMLQLVRDPWIRVWHTRHERLLDEAGAEELFGVPPRQVPEVLALMGDPSDNVPGCKGIGEKGAKELIRRWGSVKALYEHLEELPPRARRALEAHREEVELSRRLVEIRTDLDLPLDLDALRRGGGDAARLAALYRRLGFDTLLRELELPSERAPAAVATVDGAGALAAAGPGAVATVEGWVAVATGGRVTLLRAEPAAVAGTLAPRLGPEWSVHGSKELLRALRDAGCEWSAAPRDTELEAYLLDPGEPVDLESAARRHLAALPEPGGAPPGAGPAARAAVLTAALHAALAPRLEAEGLEPVYERIEAPLVPVLEAMERAGIAVDAEVLEELGRRLEASLAELEREIAAEAGTPFNVNSPQQLAEVLFERLGYPVLRRTSKTRRPSTNVEVLGELARRGYRLPALILEYREQAKLRSTYIEALLRLRGPDGRIHARFHQTVTSTGRLSSSDPNLQNIPVRTELGRQVRRAFVAAPGCRLVAADYSQIELRVLAHMSRDPGLLAAFRRGEDIHRATAAAVFGVRPGEVTPEQRRAAKTINFGLIYGMGAYSLSRELGVEPAEAQAFIDAYFARFPGVRAFLDAVLERARREGRVATMFGRIRRIANLDHPSQPVRAAAERMAINAPIQGTAADIIKLAMIELDRRLEGSGVRLVLQVHDELLLEAPEAEVAAAVEEVRRAMEGVVELEAPLVVDIGTGPSWYDAK